MGQSCVLVGGLAPSVCIFSLSILKGLRAYRILTHLELDYVLYSITCDDLIDKVFFVVHKTMAH